MKVHECFWCSDPLYKNQITRDHFLSGPVNAYIRKNHPDFEIGRACQKTCDSCHDCNNTRSGITCLFVMSQNVRENECRIERGLKIKGCKEKSFLRRRMRLLGNLIFYREMIQQKLFQENFYEFCLLEIDKILDYVPQKRNIV